MADSTPLIEFAKNQVGEYGNAYAYAFGFAWARLSEKEQKKILKHIGNITPREDTFWD
jgi:hypothetical protein